MAATEQSSETAATDNDPGIMFREAGMGQVWQRGAALRGQAFGAATELMLDLAELTVGSRVLAGAAGTGDQTLLAAQRVGPTGHVLATDIADAMLAVAADEARKAGLTNVEMRVMDAQSLELESGSFDAVISRMGLMLVPDYQKALAEIRRVLEPGGKLAVIVWSTPERNLYVLIPSLIARRHAELPSLATGQGGMFALAPGLLETVLQEAGFRDVAVQAVAAPRRFSSVQEMTGFLVESSPLLREPMAKLDTEERAAMLSEIEETMRQFDGPAGVTLAGEILVGAGIR